MNFVVLIIANAVNHLGSVLEYEITVKNLTPATGAGASQPLSPVVAATHTPRYHVFQVGELANEEVRYVAEDAINDPLLELLNNAARVFDVVQGSGVILPGASTTFRIKARIPFVQLSLVTMLVNTNDGFTGIDGVILPLQGSKELYLNAYDAGTERNTELKAHIPGPCCGNVLARVPTREVIKHHPGILGVGELDAKIYGWEDPVAKAIITRL